MRKTIIGFILLFAIIDSSEAEDGYRLWLRYDKIDDNRLLQQYLNTITSIQFLSFTPTANAAKKELIEGLQGLLGKKVQAANNAVLVAGMPTNSEVIRSVIHTSQFQALGKEGCIIRTIKTSSKKSIVITANTDGGVLYGVFHFLRLLQTQQSIQQLSIKSSPRIQHRILNHWDNLTRYVERDEERFKQVLMLLSIQEKEAVWWRNSCLLYFQTFSKMPIPEKYDQPDKTLEYYQRQRFPYAPGNTQ